MHRGAIITTAYEPTYAASTPHVSSSQSLSEAFRSSKAALWTGRLVSGFVTLFLAFDAAMKLSGAAEAVKGTSDLGYNPNVLVPLGITQLACLTLYLVPRTAPLGAILWTGYLGGAIATHVRLEHPLFSHVLFPIYVATFLWAGLFLRDSRVRSLFSAGR